MILSEIKLNKIYLLNWIYIFLTAEKKVVLFNRKIQNLNTLNITCATFSRCGTSSYVINKKYDFNLSFQYIV